MADFGSFGKPFTITALLTCHNRRELTVRCLDRLFKQSGDSSHFTLRAVLVDDGSTDQTSAAVVDQFPHVTLVAGSGDLYWAGGMALAEEVALREDPDFLLWINDDVSLAHDAVLTLVEAWRTGHSGSIFVGATCNPTSGEVSYGGARLKGRRPTGLEFVVPHADGRARQIDTFNGNVVLVPRQVYHAVGPIDGSFGHAYGDIDYGLRARAMGFPSFLIGSVGECVSNSVEGTWRDKKLAVRVRMREMVSRKAIPPGSHWRYVKRHSGLRAPAYFLATYVRAILTVLQRREVG